ncbi:MAG: cbb3-type cytochrome c oxidase subunit 3 [Hyphomicrobiaceae bacterium]
MNYHFVATISQTASLLLFLAMFIAVLAYAFWPGSRKRFDDAQKRALDINGNGRDGGGKA